MPPPDADVPAPSRPPPAHQVSPVAIARKVRHQRLTRVAAAVTLLGVLAFGAVAAVVVRSFLATPTVEESRIEGDRRLLAGIAEQVGKYVEARGRMPATLADLRSPDLESRFDAEPWDSWKHPIEYRVVDAPARTFRLRSYGPDGRPDTPDDIAWPRGASWR